MKRRTAYSQNFLRNPQLVELLVKKVGIATVDTVLDIGAGSGVITTVLARYCQHVIAIESDARVLPILTKNVAMLENVTIVPTDVFEYTLPSGTYKIFANIPFHISAKLVRMLLFATNPPVASYMIVQKQFADKIEVSTTRFTAAIGVAIAPWFTVRQVYDLKRTDYWPHPNVDTVLIELKPRATPLLGSQHKQLFGELVEACYHSPPVFTKALKRAGTTYGGKPSELPPERWVTLYAKQ
ncbi:MAG: rRNA adenine dimethyltransferase family protein [Candidatus Saccharimonas sp.]